ncbi:NAD(P)/FAD-dependent oxidoreductase [Permianibacter aggregans]|uniref:Gamma-glutamylputrescine oxidase n=1 Tax=Permianibacter aggregans TaxID=1510150 RepID=A0A4R6UR66_9GAMM|nr:FAD-binding oxidoreductase [Permianibacter aggregans]QGX39472.1 FAD-binding oxidoreductase [Permianibacter aggregans]TDQ49788.1 gamma-glutamylputrescine oxidase [Permianibacter aggregans]
MSHTEYPDSYYAASALPHAVRRQLQEDLHTDVVVIGAGYTGLSSALHLLEAGYSVVVLEAARVGWGASGRNGGQLVQSYSRDVDVIADKYGQDTARMLGSMMFEGSQIIRERVKKYQIQCDLKDGGLFVALSDKQVHGLREHKALWEQYGHKGLEFLDARQTQDVVHSERYRAALLDHWGGHIHPLNLALGEAAAVESLGGKIFEQSAVTSIERTAKPIVRTEHGSVQAKFVVVAGNAYLGGLVPELAAKSMPCGTQVIATEPLGERWQEVLPSDYCVEDCNYLLDYFRLSGDKRLIYGGGVIYGARDPEHIESIVRPKLEKTFPQLKDVRIDFAWTGNFLLTLSRLPQFGRLNDNIYYMQGYSGHGVTTTHLAGKLVAEAIKGQSERFDAFASLPHLPFPGGRLFRVPATALGAWYYSLRDKLGI